MRKTQSGYIILILSVVVTSVGVYLALNSVVLANQSRQNNESSVEAVKAESLARRCSEVAIQRLQSNRYYDGDEFVDLPDGQSCVIYSISGVGNVPRTIVTSGEAQNVTRYLQTVLYQIAPRVLIRSQALIISPADSTDPEAQILATTAPSQIRNGSLGFWLKAGNLTSLNNSRINEWIDTWSGISFTQSDVLQQPRYQLRFLNRRPGVLFTPPEALSSLAIPAIEPIITDPEIIVLGVASLNGSPATLVTTAAGWDPAWTVINLTDVFPTNTSIGANGVILEIVGYLEDLDEEARNALQTYFTTKYDL